MDKYNPKNERIKRDYFVWQKEANRKCESTIDNIRKAVDRYEIYTGYKDFRTFNKEKAMAFKKHLVQLKSIKSKKLLSKSTISSTLRHLKDFYGWLTCQKGYRNIIVSDIDYLSMNEKVFRVVQGSRFKKVPTLDQIKFVLNSMPTDSEIDRRNRAIIAFTILTGMRDGAMASLKLKHVDLDRELVEQLPNEVHTKFGKTIFTYFYPLGDDIRAIVVNWINYLYQKKHYDGNDPVFPRTKVVSGSDYKFHTEGIEPVHWNSASQIRKIFREAFAQAGLSYYCPHSFRSTITLIGEKVCRTAEEFKAWSQNLGHENVSTTFNSYGHVDEYRQGEIIKNLSVDRPRQDGITDLNRKMDILIENARKCENNS